MPPQRRKPAEAGFRSLAVDEAERLTSPALLSATWLRITLTAALAATWLRITLTAALAAATWLRITLTAALAGCLRLLVGFGVSTLLIIIGLRSAYLPGAVAELTSLYFGLAPLADVTGMLDLCNYWPRKR